MPPVDGDASRLGDFTTRPRVIILSLIAMLIGLVGAFIALALLRLIGLFTNLFFFQRWSTTLDFNTDGAVPAVGEGLVLMPRSTSACS